MNYQELLQKYKNLQQEFNRLKLENSRLKAELDQHVKPEFPSVTLKAQLKSARQNGASKDGSHGAEITMASDSVAKIHLFRSLFQGRTDVYAKRWENKAKGLAGYAPVCLNQWRTGICGKPQIPCSACKNRAYAELDETVLEDHLKGHIVVGVYPMLPDETCHFLAMDFDKAEWGQDISAIRAVCRDFQVPIAVERSRSGQGGHAWFFFECPISAALARRFGTALLTCTMNRRHEIPFKSYDRLFPSQDTMPKGGLGNLIALPLQKAAREKANSEFIDNDFQPYRDQWAFLAAIQRISEDRLKHLILTLADGYELGELKVDEEEEKPWKTPNPQTIPLDKNDFPDTLTIVQANMLFIPKQGISSRALNRIKRLASFQNPMFYRLQAMRLPTYGHPRVISCADETRDYLCLPRGCAPDLLHELERCHVGMHMIDKTFKGKPINVTFKGRLRSEQALALSHLLRHDTGILSGTTAFGKTIVAIKLIAEKKINTLILVNRVSLLAQWKERLTQFLEIGEWLPDGLQEKDGKKIKGIIGQIGAGQNRPGGMIDIAVMQSLSRQGKVKACVQNYGLVIADECHHASAFTYELILKTSPAKYVYGLTATPTRKDGRHPILFMHCGPIRYRDNPIQQAQNRPFDHFIIPRFTALRVPLGMDPQEVTIQSLYAEIMENDFRDQQIIDDVVKNHQQGRHCLVLTLRTAHVERLVKKLKIHIPDIIPLTGGMGHKASRQAFDRIAEIPTAKAVALVATGHFIGEGFDEPRLDTLFLAMPISWKGTLQQYAGRLHRLFETKKEVRIYDYVDIQVPMLEKMYQKRLNGYASMGYKAKGDDIPEAPLDIIFTQENFLPVFNQDIVKARKEIVIVSPFIRPRRTRRMCRYLSVAIGGSVRITIVTRPKEDFPEKNHEAFQKALDLLIENGINIIFKSNIHQKFAVMDQKIVWYGSINLLSYGSAQESIMRLESSHIANELVKSGKIEAMQNVSSRATPV